MKFDESYYLQEFLKECNFIDKEEKANRCITDDLKFSSDDCDESGEKSKFICAKYRPCVSQTGEYFCLRSFAIL